MVNEIDIINAYIKKMSENTLFGYYEQFIKENKLGNTIGVIDSGLNKNHTHESIISDSELFAKYLYNKIQVEHDLSLAHSHEENSPLIAILSEKGYNQVIAALAIMKAGGSYLPLSISWPIDRIDEVLVQGKTKILLISKSQSLLPQIQRHLFNKYTVLVIEDLLSEIYSNANLTKQLAMVNLPYVNANAPAYVIFTSGSTGRPKGVTISHASALNTIIAVNQKFTINSSDVILAISELSFDLSVYDIFGVLSVGGSVVFPDQNKLIHPTFWLDLIDKYNITLWNTVPQLAELLIDELSDSNLEIDSLRLFLLSGDKIPINLPAQIKLYFPRSQVISLGGATECSIWSIWYDINLVTLSKKTAIPYGVAMPNQNIYVLNDNLKILPVDQIGEIFIGGDGLAINYYGDEQKTEASFIKHTNLGRLYKTGDLGSLHKDGYIEFKGRKDGQVKVNGNRVELGEIENKLLTHKKIKQAVICYQSYNDSVSLRDDKALIAYYVLDKNHVDNELNNYLQSWTDVYDDLYDDLSIDKHKNQKYDTSGWISSYTSEIISEVEILDFINNTIDRIKSLNPKNILEIGCGSGQILFNLLDTCDNYIGSDFSQSTIKYLNSVIREEGLNTKASAVYCSAHNINDIKVNYPIDTIIINSVTQYFPDINYLMTVIENSIAKINTTGQIFIGDVRDYRLLKLFHFSVLSYQGLPLEENIINTHSMQDTELLVSPEFFVYCKVLFSRIKHVEVLAKNGHYTNEMNSFRYDVILHIDGATDVKKLEIPEFIYSEDILSILNCASGDELFIRYINARVYKEYIEYGKVIERNNNLVFKNVLTIEELYELAKKYDYNLKVLHNLYDPTLLDLIFYRDHNNNVYYSDTTSLLQNNNLTDMANNPIQNIELSDSEIASNLQKYLSTQLPAYMVPRHYIKLFQIPLTLNGKVDYTALPRPTRFASNSIPIAARNDLESKIVNIWSDILRLPKEQISIEDNFFKLGGNSLLAVRLRRRLAMIREFKKIKAADIFKYTTIRELTDFGTKSFTARPKIKLVPDLIPKEVDLEVAIIGMSGAFSGGKNIEDYWEMINSGQSGLMRYSIEKCRSLGIEESLLNNSNFIPVTGKIVGTEEFDHEFWGITPEQVYKMDPQIRKFLEHAWYVLEKSGYLLKRSECNVGVFAGGRNSPSIDKNIERFGKGILGTLGAAGELNTQNSLAMQVSYLLGLTGPSSNINTACSTSMVAIIEACKSLVYGYCDMALAGGVSLILPHEVGYIYKEAGIFSRDGQSRVFDENSSGMVSGSGVGVLLLKTLKQAKKDKDKIIAVIKGYAVNNDSNRKMNYTAPSVTGQTECIVNAHKMSGINSDMVSYVECHGTGTCLGDAIEVRALNEAFKYNNNDYMANNKCDIGSVKANIGHAELASGVAGVIKVCKMFEHNIIPTQINFNEANHNIDLDNTPFTITTVNKQWLSNSEQARIAGVSSFGIGGTNAHIVMSDYQSEEESYNKDDLFEESIELNAVKNNSSRYILPLSAKSIFSLVAYKQDFVNYLKRTSDNLADIAYNLQLKRESYINRISIVTDSVTDAINKFTQIESIKTVNIRPDNQTVVFLFPGQGSQYPNMTLELYENDKVYKDILDNCFSIIYKQLNIEFKQILFPTLFNFDNRIAQIHDTKWAQLALFIVGYSLTKWLEKFYIIPDTCLGYSAGELVAATINGVFSLENAIKIVSSRGSLMSITPQGSMLYAECNVDHMSKIIQGSKCEIAIVNSERQCTVSGALEDIAKLEKELDKLAIPSILLRVSHGYHSYLMDDIIEKFISEFKGVKLSKPKKTFISSVTGDFIDAYSAMDPKYWARHIRERNLFASGINTVLKHFINPVFIQVGPGKELLDFVKQDHIKNVNTAAILNDRFYGDNCKSIEDVLSKLWLHGVNVNFSNYRSSYKFFRSVDMPNYHFNNQRYTFNVSDDTPQDYTKTHTQVMTNIMAQVIEKDLPAQYYDIARIFLQILGINRISIHDDFFSLGGSSITALSLISQLKSIDIYLTLADITEVNSIAKIFTFANNASNQFERVGL